MKIDLFYRFRRIDNLFGEFDELEKQSIYFASPDQLNDPVEGFRDIYWKADEVIWGNLFNHYLFCLMNFSLDYLSHNSDVPNNKINIFFSYDDCHENFKKHFDILSEEYMNSDIIRNAIVNIVKYRDKVSECELSHHLSIIHYYALNCIFDYFVKIKLVCENAFKSYDIKEDNYFNEHYFKTLYEIEDKHGYGEIEKLLGISKKHSYQKGLYFNYSTDNIATNTSYIINIYPFEYIKMLQKFMYPEWFTACFMSKSTNSSVWGNYGENHTGVCLIFSPENDDSGINSITLGNAINGCDSDGVIKGLSSFKFHPIRYTHKQESVSFFELIAQLPHDKLYKTWFINKNGDKSSLMPTYDDEWRTKYWDIFYKAITQKTKDWEYENEHRLILNNMMGSYGRNDMTLKYDFKSLKGIIFGLNTSEENKYRILKVIERKIIDNKHYDFKFYQAYYCRETGEIKNYKLDLLKINMQ